LEQANRDGGWRHRRQAQDASLLRRIVSGLQLEFARTWRPQYVHLPAPRQLQPVRPAAIASNRRKSRSHAHASTAS
jgi:hypothetical protein